MRPTLLGLSAAGLAALAAFAPLSRTPAATDFDVVFTGGTVVDGTGSPGRRADVGVSGDRITAIGDLAGRTAGRTIDATGSVVAPGFIDMLGWSQFTILVDNRGVSKVTQGVTTEITGEGWSPAPVNPNTLRDDSAQFAAWNLAVDWRDFDGYFRRIERSGTPFNMASFVGATTVRKYVIGDGDRAPTSEELAQMVALVDTAMRQGALGVSSSLIYAPASYAKTPELLALARAAARHGGVYASHIRNEADRIRPALEEAFTIGRQAGLPVEIWHLKLSGRANWGRMPQVLRLLETRRRAGLKIGANSYPYTASATGLDATIPNWVKAGGKDSEVVRLRDPAIRARVRRELIARSARAENMSRAAGGLSGVLVLGVLDPSLRRYQGRRINEIAQAEHKDPYDALFDLIVADHANTGAAYFSMSEDDVRRAVQAPWIGVGMDFGATAADGPLSADMPHPRAYGTFPRILGHYVRELHALSLETAVRKMTGVPAERMSLRERGILREGYFADITVFDPNTVADRATFEHPTRVAAGIQWVMVNGKFTLEQGRLTSERPGRALRGPGWRAP